MTSYENRQTPWETKVNSYKLQIKNACMFERDMRPNKQPTYIPLICETTSERIKRSMTHVHKIMHKQIYLLIPHSFISCFKRVLNVLNAFRYIDCDSFLHPFPFPFVVASFIDVFQAMFICSRHYRHC